MPIHGLTPLSIISWGMAFDLVLQAYAEGFGILRGKADARLPESERFTLDLADIAEVWRRGSVISSWLLDLTAMALAEDSTLANFSGAVEDSGEGRWTVDAAVEEALPANVLAASLFERFRFRQDHNFGDRLLSAMRTRDRFALVLKRHIVFLNEGRLDLRAACAQPAR
jgi:6-phosphogluconate dehydrogenase (decarboxylating)